MIDLFISLSLFLAAALLGAAYALRVAQLGVAHDARVDRVGGSPLLGKGPMEMGVWAMRPVARAIVDSGLSADVVSWTSLALGASAGVAVALGHFGVGAALVLGSAACDGLDGMVARATATANDAGGLLDATVDRYGELFFFGGAAFALRDEATALIVALAAMTGAIMVSYGSAKAEALRTTAPRGAMRRQERAVYMILGAALVPVTTAIVRQSGAPDGLARLPIVLALALIAVVGNVSAIRRLAAVARAVRPSPPLHLDGRRLAEPARDGSPAVLSPGDEPLRSGG